MNKNQLAFIGMIGAGLALSALTAYLLFGPSGKPKLTKVRKFNLINSSYTINYF